MSALEEYIASFAGETGYLNWAAFGPLSPEVRTSMHEAVEVIGGYDPREHLAVNTNTDRAAELVAELLGVGRSEVVLRPSSTDALQHAFTGLDGAVIAGAGEFPSISLTLQRASAASSGAVSPRWIDPVDGRVTTDAVAEALDDDVTAVAVSHVDYRTGYRADLPALRDLLGPDRLLIVDAVQSFGVVDEDWTAADVIAGHGYKWLRAGRGTGFARFSPRASECIRPVLSGITGIASDGPFTGAVPPPASGARAYSTSVPDHLAAVRLATALDEVRRAGVATIAERVTRNVDEMLAAVERHGIPVGTPQDPVRRAGILSLTPADPEGLGRALSDAGLSVTSRGGAVRVAAHAGTGAETLRMLEDGLTASGNRTFTL
ncbi:aminotransferase class V-fold PLP-dependent enzyme [Microbacterium sp. ARD32]|uniref:aminotransferase class V-fold PLP-dependent enzyme n=1 Tax=Microbacterium sp. ARD32 TaxID=2962577 RepID=UPI00288172C4|nr:aminotransferase class V-fold PLP-dependent enzyme [Microbacterium sp. ARD32]MDT0156615.1 aminotransferase class V-fold PLP-dependent enzyme [Microbacterium sp. ARD32]